MNTKQIEKSLSNESVIKLVNGIEIRGSKEVAFEIMECCRAYNKGWVLGFTVVTIATWLGILAGKHLINKEQEKIGFEELTKQIDEVLSNTDKILIHVKEEA